MSLSGSSLNYALIGEQFARQQSFVARGPVEAPPPEPAVTGDEAGRFAVGSVVTLRYRYKVAENGHLVPQGAPEMVQEEANSSTQQRTSRQRRNLADENPSARLRAWAPIRPELSPSDELGLFSFLAGQSLPFTSPAFLRATPTRLHYAVHAETVEAQAEDGSSVEVEILAPAHEQRAAVGEYSASFRRAQTSVAGLYARNAFVFQHRDGALLLSA